MTHPMTEERKKKLRELDAKATQGPWVFREIENPLNALGKERMPNAVPLMEQWVTTDWIHPQLKNYLPIVSIAVGPYGENTHTIYIRPEDAHFIAASRTGLRECLDEIERLESSAVALRASHAVLLFRLSSLLAMVEGECPSLLRDHHEWPKIQEAIHAAEEIQK